MPLLRVGLFKTSILNNTIESNMKVGYGKSDKEYVCNYHKVADSEDEYYSLQGSPVNGLEIQPDVIVAPFHFSKLLYQCGILDPKKSDI